MLAKLWSEAAQLQPLKINKYVNNENASLRGAFSAFDKITFCIENRRAYGIGDAVLHIAKDGESECRIPFDIGERGELSVTLGDLDEGLYWYSVEFIRGWDSLWSEPINNVDFRLAPKKSSDFRLLIYEKDFKTPDWFKGGVMYQIFPDRFYKSGRSPLREGAQNEDDWYAPISQYASKPGDALKNDLFYGGDLWGIAEKLPYLKSLGVSTIYLNPIFKAASNHKYDTGDYTKTDEAFGGNEALDNLITKANAENIKVILDGVFNHTGDDSVYFNKYGNYPGKGAYKNPDSPMRDWYCFGSNDDEYECWWGIKIHPRLNHANEECRHFFTGKDGIGASYIKKGCGGWRLDVADELPDVFLDEFRKSVKAADSDALIIGEVWENAADKIAYGVRRRYLRGAQLDSVMNYPFRNAILEFLKNSNGEFLANTLTEIYSSYPKCVCDCLMNIVGTHDTERIITVLGDRSYSTMSNDGLSVRKMSKAERAEGAALLKIASAVQYTVYGVPSVFYGDEAGVEGGRDPFCRAPFPWGREDTELEAWYKRLGDIRKRPVFAEGDFTILSAGGGYIVFERSGEEKIVIAANVKNEALNVGFTGEDLLSGKNFSGIVEPKSAVIVSVSSVAQPTGECADVNPLIGYCNAGFKILE